MLPKILFLSSVCSSKKDDELFKKYKKSINYASQKYGTLLCNGLKKCGYTVEFISRLYLTSAVTPRKYFRWETDGDYTYISRLNLPFIGNIFAVFSALKYIRRWQLKNKDGVIICDTLLGELSLALILRGKKNKRLALVTDIPLLMAKKRRGVIKKFFGYLKETLINAYDGYILLTEQMNDIVNKKFRPYALVEGLVDIELEKKQQVKKYEKHICLFAGLLHEVYGIKNLVQGFILADIENAELHIYGNGDYAEQLKKIALNNEKIKYFGEMPNSYILEEEMKATLLINPRPSTEEYTKYSCPSKNLEYMSSGTPLLTTHLSCIPKEYDEYIYFLDDETPEGIAKKLSTILQYSEKSLSEFGQKAKTWVIENKNNILQSEKISKLIQIVRETKNV